MLVATPLRLGLMKDRERPKATMAWALQPMPWELQVHHQVERRGVPRVNMD